VEVFKSLSVLLKDAERFAGDMPFSTFLDGHPKLGPVEREALLTFVVADELAAAVAATVADSARSGNESGDGLVWTTPVAHVTHHRTGRPLEEAA
jgi:nitrogen regulatory protein PII